MSYVRALQLIYCDVSGCWADQERHSLLDCILWMQFELEYAGEIFMCAFRALLWTDGDVSCCWKKIGPTLLRSLDAVCVQRCVSCVCSLQLIGCDVSGY